MLLLMGYGSCKAIYLFIDVEFGGFTQIMSRNGVEWSGNLKQGLREAECVFLTRKEEDACAAYA